MREYNAGSPKQGRKRFNSIVKTTHFSYLLIIYLCCRCKCTMYCLWTPHMRVPVCIDGKGTRRSQLDNISPEELKEQLATSMYKLPTNQQKWIYMGLRVSAVLYTSNTIHVMGIIFKYNDSKNVNILQTKIYLKSYRPKK